MQDRTAEYAGLENGAPEQLKGPEDQLRTDDGKSPGMQTGCAFNTNRI